MNDLKNFLVNCLTIIDYRNDKEEFINRLSATIYLTTVNELLTSLPQEKQGFIKQQLSSAATPEELLEVVNGNFEKNIFEDELKKTSEKLFVEYIESIEPSLSEEQKTKLYKYFASQNLQK